MIIELGGIMVYWIYLLLAIVTEVTGTVSMKYASISGGITGDIIMYVMITCSYILLSVAIKKIPLGVAYALWEGVGGLAITCISVTWFDEPMSILKATGLILLLIGIGLVKDGTKKPQVKSQQSLEKENHHATV